MSVSADDESKTTEDKIKEGLEYLHGTKKQEFIKVLGQEEWNEYKKFWEEHAKIKKKIYVSFCVFFLSFFFLIFFFSMMYVVVCFVVCVWKDT